MESAAKQTAIEKFIKECNKNYGEGSVMAATNARQRCDVYSTGSIMIDIATGIGGIPRGRLVEIFGPESSGKTTLCLQVAASCQKSGGTVLYVDDEHALDPTYAANLGVDLQALIISQPSSAEESLGIIKTALAIGAFDMIVLDSVAGLTPQAVIDGDVGDSHVGRVARLMSQNLQHFVSEAAKSNTCLAFINQTREKIGVMYGCFNYSTRVLLEDGSTEKIGKIVNQKLPVKVMSFDPSNWTVSPKPIVNYFDNGNAERFLQFTVEKGTGGNGISQFACTENHLIFTPEGETEAGCLSIGDTVMGLGRFTMSKTQLEVAIGSILGDANLKKTKGGTTRLRFTHGTKQTEYCRWKEGIFCNTIGSSGTGKTGMPFFETRSSCDLNKYREESYTKQGRRVPSLDYFTIPSLAIWYMDDGTFGGNYSKWGNGKSSISAKWMNEEDKKKIVEKLAEIGVPVPRIDKKGFSWDSSGTKELHGLIASYVPECMEYKIHPNFRGAQKTSLINFTEERRSMTPVKILKIKEKPKTRSMRKFDLEVDGNHTYIVDGVGVHNSPETTNGGKAIRFYSSMRIHTARTTLNKDGQDVLGNYVKVKIVKNKLAPPFTECEPEILYGEGFNREYELVDLASGLGIIEKSGSWYSYDGERMGQGKDAARQFLLANPEITDKIEVLVKEQYGISA